MGKSSYHNKPILAVLLSGGIIVFGCDNVLNIDEYSTNGCPAPGTKQCAGKLLQVCQINGAWETEAECAIQCATDRCIDCVPDTFECDKATNSLKRCGADFQWSFQSCVNQTCVSDHCEGICAPGDRCSDALHVESCVDGQWFESVTCSQVAQCVNGECRQCRPDEFRCNESTVETCLNSNWFATKDCSLIGEWGSVCLNGDCAGECAEGRTRCEENVSQTCDADGHWQSADCTTIYRTCDPETGTCAGECASTIPPTCDGNVLKSCTTTGEWTYTDCGVLQTCVIDHCASTCGPTSARCNGNIVEACSSEGIWTQVSTCADTCAEGMCTRPTCNCGPTEKQDCCASPFVPGGTFQRGNATTAQAKLSPFRLDTYEITVGRFRKFVSMYDPLAIPEGGGTNPYVPDSGWKSKWISFLPANANQLATNLACHPSSTWTTAAGENENQPLNCLSWYEAFAFCIWDGGFLPTEAEWNFAAAGGNEQREYPWSVPATSKIIDINHAAFQCLQPGSFDYNDCILAKLPNAGSRSPLGDAKFGHKDLAGSLFEWTLDVYDTVYPNGNECQDCANLIEVPEARRTLRGGGWNGTAAMLYTHVRAQLDPADRQWFVGARCARGL